MSEKVCVYISGPMSGHKDYNFSYFNRVEKYLVEHGFDVFNPAALGVIDNWAWQHYMEHDIKELVKLKQSRKRLAMVMLDGWENSTGARVEHTLAEALNIPIFKAKEEKELFEYRDNVEVKSDAVNPSHYKQGKFETIEVIEDITKDGFDSYLVGNIIKYISRYKYKNGLEDLKKASWYLNRLIGTKSESESE